MTETTIVPTFEHFKLPGGLDLAINSNRKLKTVLIKVYFASDLGEEASGRSLLPNVLRRGTETFPDMQSLNRHMEHLYGTAFWSTVSKVGEWSVTSYQLDVVNDVYLPEREGLFEQGLDLLRELLFAPRLEGGAFLEEYVLQEKENQKRVIKSLIDEKTTYATFRCIEEMCSTEPFRLSEQGTVEGVDNLSAAGLYESYSKWMCTSPLSVYVTGDVDVAAVRSLVEERFTLPERDAQSLRPLPKAVPAPDQPKEIRERLDVQQGKLVIGFRFGVTYEDPSYVAALVMNGILGAASHSHSKLFQNVREKASLAYSASSWVERTKGLLFITCGISAENYEKALAISLEQVEQMKRGEFSDEDIESTRKTILNGNQMLEDNLSSLAAVDYVWSLHGQALDLLSFREKLRAVSRDDIVEAAQKLRHDTTYFLHG